MNIKQVGKLVGAVVIVGLIIGFIFTSDSSPAPKPIPDEAVVLTETVSLSIEGLPAEKTYAISSGETVLTLLEGVNETEPTLQLTLKEYEGLGVLILSMNNRSNGTDDKYWQYQVNGVTPLISADKYILKGGDKVEWNFSQSEF